jgi:DNA-binding response OmpR family regulator
VKKILIIDESRFSRICSAILENEGFDTEIFKDSEGQLPKSDYREFGLIITSYPFSYFLFENIKKMDLPTIILTDHINRSFINLLEGFNNSYCMVKPLDYQEFRALVKQIVNSDMSDTNGVNIL